MNKTINQMKARICVAAWAWGLLLLPISLLAQNLEQALTLPVRQVQVLSVGNDLEISFTVELDTLNLPSNRLIHLTPFLIHGEQTLTLHPLTVAGRRQFLLQQRKSVHKLLIHRTNGRPQSLTYTERFPYQEWMEGAKLVLSQDVCGCGESVLSQHQAAVKTLQFEIPVYEVQPAVAFVTPKAETVKYRTESGRAYLDFPVNQTEINPDYRNNPTELKAIAQTIERVKNDSLTRITHLNIHGYASPEGSFANNRRLAQGRAEALKRLVSRQYQLPDTLFAVESTPEDWEGLAAWVEQSHLTHKEEVQRILASSLEPDAKNFALQRVAGGKVYAQLLKDVYPSLRHSDYTVRYVVRSFEVEEAKQILRTRPQLLSLDELFAIASTYEAGSEPFNEVFDIAVRLFPDDTTANLNAALAALLAQEYRRAAAYLEKAGHSPEAMHARGVWFLLTERYQEAENCLKQAEAAGVPQAKENLKQLKLKLEHIEKTKTIKIKKQND